MDYTWNTTSDYVRASPQPAMKHITSCRKRIKHTTSANFLVLLLLEFRYRKKFIC